MPRFARGARLFCLVVPAWFVAPACDNHFPVAPLRDGDAVCSELVQYCAAPAAAFGEPYRSCYDTGMQGDADACLAVEDQCVEPCYGENMALSAAGGEAGAGGASGASNESGAAGTPSSATENAGETSAGAGGA